MLFSLFCSLPWHIFPIRLSLRLSMFFLFDWGLPSICFFPVLQPPAACFLWVTAFLPGLFPFPVRISPNCGFFPDCSLPLTGLFPIYTPPRIVLFPGMRFRSGLRPDPRREKRTAGVGCGGCGARVKIKESRHPCRLSSCVISCCLCIMKKKTCKRSCANAPALPFLSGPVRGLS